MINCKRVIQGWCPDLDHQAGPTSSDLRGAVSNVSPGGQTLALPGLLPGPQATDVREQRQRTPFYGKLIARFFFGGVHIFGWGGQGVNKITTH